MHIMDVETRRSLESLRVFNQLCIDQPIFAKRRENSAGGVADPILEYKSTEGCKPLKPADSHTGEVEIQAYQCRCGSVWCPRCFRSRRVPKISARLKNMNWESVRQIVLTLDPKKFDSPQQAHEYIASHKVIPQLIHNLKRTAGVTVKDWLWCMEWHNNGFPHWHLFVETEKTGRASMIGGENIRHYWTYGSVFESPIKNQRHWDNFTGYFQKTGYFEKKKKHQMQLPAWAQKLNKSIRRTGSKAGVVLPSAPIYTARQYEKSLEEPKIKFISGKKHQKPRPMREYEVILKSCATWTQMLIIGPEGESWYKVHIPFADIVTLPGEFKDGLGYCMSMPLRDLLLFLNLNDILSDCT